MVVIRGIPVFHLVLTIALSFIPGFENGSERKGPNNFKHFDQEEGGKSHYRAAVVEYKPISIGSQPPLEAVLENVGAYADLIGQAGAQNVDIIIFPEYGITTADLPSDRKKAREFFVQTLPLELIPCDNTSDPSSQYQVLHRLSCAAKLNQIYVVVNLGEYEECSVESDPNCPVDGAYHYNTNLVFSRTGAIIARYRKYHLYFEPQFNYPPLDYSTFSTDFGVEFGLFTCFDIIFAHPAVELVASKGIRNFIFPTAWVDELPFLMAIQAQSLWAQSNRVNLLASGYHQPDRGSMGSGIYSGDTMLVYTFDPSSGTKLLISDVPLVPATTFQNHCQFHSNAFKERSNEPALDHFWLREDLSNCSYKTIDPNLGNVSMCHEDTFCCDVEFDLVSNPYSGSLKLLVFDGRRTVAAKRDWFEWQVCAVIYCLNDTIESCTENIRPSISNASHPKFRSLNMRAKPVKLEYDETRPASKPAMSLIDTHFRLIPPTFFDVVLRNEQENEAIVNVHSKNGCGLENINVKTIAIIQKVYNSRV